MNQVEVNGLRGTQTAEQPPRPDNAATTESSAQKKATEKPLLKDKKRLVFFAAGLLVTILFVAFGLINMRRASTNLQTRFGFRYTSKKPSGPSPSAPNNPLPLLDAGHPPQPENGAGLATPEQIAQTAKRQVKPNSPANLGGIPPFEGTQPWQPAPYHPGLQPAPANEDGGNPDLVEAKNELNAMDKPSLVFVKSSAPTTARSTSPDPAQPIDWGIGLLPGTRLRARLESAVNTAVQTPVVAVIEYNYEQNGEIVVPAGSKAFGHLEAADRSGYIGVRFDSLVMPDGSSVNLEAGATDLSLRPLRGKVEGRHTGKNILVRSFAGVGEVAATLVGRGSLNQPLSEGDLLRERVSNNIGQASDQTVANLAIGERIVVSVPAGTEIYVVLQKSAKESTPTRAMKGREQTNPGQPSIQELRQLLQLQKELGQSASTEGANH